MTSYVSRYANKAFKPFAIALVVSSAYTPTLYAQTIADQSLGEVIVTASRAPQKVSDVLSDIIVITSEEIARSGQTSLIDLLQIQRGIEVARNGGAGNSGSVYIRGGSSNQTVLLIDGVRSFSSTSGDPTWSAIPLSQIDRIEIVLGPLSTFYGADAVGGVIQVFTKKGDGKPHVTFSAGAGTYGEQVITAGVSGANEGEHVIKYAVTTSQEKSDGFSSTSKANSSFNPDDDGYEKDSASGQFSWELAKGHELGFTFMNSRNDAKFDNGISVPPYDTRGITDVDVYSLYSRNQITANWTSLLQLSRSYNKDQSYGSAAAFDIANFDSTQDQLTWKNDFKIGTDLLQLLVERREEKVDSNQAELNRERSTNSVAVAYHLKRGPHLGSASMRYDDNTAFGSHTTGSIGYGYSVSDTLRLSASYGTSFRAPTYNDLYFVLFGSPFGIASNQPEKGKNAEVGLHYDDGTSTFSAVYYQNKITDLLVYEPSATSCPSASYIFGCTRNVDEALLKGISLSASTKFNNGIRLYGSVDLQDPRDETHDTLLTRRAKKHGNIGVDYSVGSWSVGGDVYLSGYRYNNGDNTEKLAGYSLLNLHMSYDLNDNWQLFGRWNNVTDKDYVLAAGYETPGSNVFAGIRYGFK